MAPNGRVDVGYQGQKVMTATTPVQATLARTGRTPIKISTASSDPAASAQNNLARQFWGDYNTLVSTNAAAYFIYTDSRNGAGCTAVDAYQHAVDGSGPAATKPAPENVCPKQFGNTDVFVSQITP